MDDDAATLLEELKLGTGAKGSRDLLVAVEVVDDTVIAVAEVATPRPSPGIKLKF